MLPHVPALLPHALKAGFASLDERAVAALGFEHVVFVRAAQSPRRRKGEGSVVERFVGWWLSQLRWMIPQQEQPVRAATFAALVVALARALPAACRPAPASSRPNCSRGRRNRRPRRPWRNGSRRHNRPMPAALANDCFLRACLRESTPHTPVWLMRQAGRYLPEYRATRARAGSFMGLATNVDFATEVTLQPLERYPLDAAILFSDILTVPDAMGLGLSFAEGEGPRLAHPLRDEAAVAALRVPDLDRLRYVFDAVRSIRAALAGRVPLIGFSGSPWDARVLHGGGAPARTTTGT